MPALLLTNVSFGRSEYLNGHPDSNLRWPRGGILISISDRTEGATPAMRDEYVPTAGRLGSGARDFHSRESAISGSVTCA